MVSGFRWMLLTGLLLLSACGYHLNTQQIETDIEADIERQGRRVTLNGVICPDRVAKQAEAYFRCVGELDSGEIFTINVIQQDDDGTVLWEIPSSKTLINLVSLEADLQDELSRVVSQRVAVSCDGAYRVNARGDSFECDVVGLVTAGTDRIESVLVRVDGDGNLSWQEVKIPGGASTGQGIPAGTAARATPRDESGAVATNPDASGAAVSDPSASDSSASDSSSDAPDTGGLEADAPETGDLEAGDSETGDSKTDVDMSGEES